MEYAPEVAEPEVGAGLSDHRVRTLSFPTTTTATRVLLSAHCRLAGVSLLETTGSAGATVEIYDGRDNSGQLVAVVALASGTSLNSMIGNGKVDCRNGIAVVVTAGSVRGAVHFCYEDA